LGGPCATLGWPKGDPWVTQSQTQSAEGRKALKLRGAKTAALPTVIVSKRRSREPNDLNRRSPPLHNYQITHLPNSVRIPRNQPTRAFFHFSMSLSRTHRPETLSEYRAFLGANQLRSRPIR
jgi:hypothetical protein